MGVRKEGTEVLEEHTLSLYLRILKQEEEVNRPRRARPSAEIPCLSPPLGLQREGVRGVSVTLGTLGGSHCICRPIRTQGTVTEKELCMVSMSEA